MRRRAFLAGLAGGAGAWPLAADAQQPRKPRVGFLHPGQSEYVSLRIVAFREGLGAPGGRGEAEVEIVARMANERFDQLPEMARELVGLGLQAICAVSPPAVRAAQAATRSVPIVAMDLESDPVASGWAASLARPGGNVTGIFLDFPDFTAKCLQLLREALPVLAKLAVLWHPAAGDLQLAAARNAAAALGITVEVFEVSRVADFGAAFRAMAEARAEGVLMLSTPLFGGNPQPLAELALKHRLAAVTIFPEFAEKGGLIGYGPDLQALFAQAGTLTRKALQGAAAADLPVERPSRFKLVANLKTAKAIGLALPTSILLRADEVIE
jgi:putative tryptophan/tyrosine transport system substrate-binding protein